MSSRRHVVARTALILLAAAIAWYGVAWLRHTPPAEPLAAIAHRGGAGGAAGSGTAEGTIGAFEASVAAGADWLEFDVRRTADGALIVLHDATVDRTTDGTGPVAALTLAEVQALDAGGNARIPIVQEVLSLAKRTGTPILPELKDGPINPGLTGQLVDLLRANEYLDHSVIQAFEPETLEELRRLAPDATACYVSGPWRFDIASPPADAAYVCPMGEMVLLDPDMVRQAHEAGRKVFAWWATAESGVTNTVLEAYGVDGLIVDDVGSVVNR